MSAVFYIFSVDRTKLYLVLTQLTFNRSSAALSRFLRYLLNIWRTSPRRRNEAKTAI